MTLINNNQDEIGQALKEVVIESIKDNDYNSTSKWICIYVKYMKETFSVMTLKDE